MRVKHYSLRTEKIYIGWIRRFILANAKRHPREMGAAEVEAFLSLLAVQQKVAASTQNQALSALLFLYRVVLGIQLPWMEGVVRAKRPKRVPTVLSQDEARSLLAHMEGRPQLLASLLYGTGMRLMECLRLRVKDVDFARNEITIRGGKGAKDRHTVLPKSLVEPLQREIERARTGPAVQLRPRQVAPDGPAPSARVAVRHRSALAAPGAQGTGGTPKKCLSCRSLYAERRIRPRPWSCWYAAKHPSRLVAALPILRVDHS